METFPISPIELLLLLLGLLAFPGSLFGFVFGFLFGLLGVGLIG